MYPLRKAIIANISGSILNLSSVYLMDGSVLIPRDHPKGHQQRACLLAGAKRRQSDEDTRRQSDHDKDQGETQIQRALSDFHTFTFLDSVFMFREIARDTPYGTPHPFSLSILDRLHPAVGSPECPEKFFGNPNQSSIFNRPVNLEKSTPLCTNADPVVSTRRNILDRTFNC